MKKIISIILASVMLAAALASCANVAPASAIGADITITSSDAKANAEWLDARLDAFPTKVVMGTDGSAYGVDVSALENDGYIMRTVAGETLIFAKTSDGLDAAVRKYAKAAASNEAIVDATYHEGVRVKKLTIGDHDISEFRIVVNEGAGEHKEYFQNWIKVNVASSLRSLIAIATGVNIPVDAAFCANDAAFDGPVFVFNKVEETDEFSQSDFIYEVGEHAVVFTYSDMVGAKYCMLMFLQEQLGWQDISYGDDYLPEADEIAIPVGAKNETHAMFDYGLFPYNSYSPPADAFQNTLRDRVNGTLYNKWYKISNAGHGITRWTNQAAFKQICYTDDAEYSQIYGKIYTFISDQLEAGKVIGEDLTVIDVAQSDYFGYCVCKNCTRIKGEENGSNAGPVVRWVNRLEEEMDEEEFDGQTFDGLKYTFFAYHGSNKPCLTHCNEDVYVTFCTDGHCSRHWLDGSQCQWESFDELGTLGPGYLHLNNNHYYEFIRGWCDICPNTYVWFYALDNNVHQYTIIHQMYEDFKLLSECGVKGVFWQIPYHGLGIVKIEQQLGMLMNLNPDMTKQQYWDEVDRLLEKTYGDGWADIREYIDLWEESEIEAERCSNCWAYGGNTVSDAVDIPTYMENWDRMIELLEDAITKAKTARQQAHCELLTVSMYYIGCMYAYFDAYKAGDSERLAVLAERYDLLVKRLEDNGYDISAIVGVDNGKTFIYRDINQMAWTCWAADSGIGINIADYDIPEEWIVTESEETEA